MKQKNYIPVDGIEDGIDFDAHYKIGPVAVSWRLLGWHAEWVPIMCYCTDDDGNEYETESGEFEQEADCSKVVAVMVGDDRKHIVDRDDIELIPEDSFCRSCGQIGCGCNVYA